MATAPIESTEPAAAPAAGGIKKLLPLIVAVVAGLAVGGASGAFFVGPAMATGVGPGGAPVPAVAGAGDEAEGADAEHAKSGGKEGEGAEGAAAAKSVHVLDNIVLNPAGSGGTRFLLLSVAFELKNAAVLDDMKARDAELRDVVLVTLGAKTVEQLSDMAVREPLKAELRAAAEKTFKKGGIKRIYFPQFVIQ
jgi:flagellar FliL protein